jgi:hypothetical protein
MRIGLYFSVGFAGFNVATAKRAFSVSRFEQGQSATAEIWKCSCGKGLSRSASVSVSTRKEEQEGKRFLSFLGARKFQGFP